MYRAFAKFIFQKREKEIMYSWSISSLWTNWFYILCGLENCLILATYNDEYSDEKRKEFAEKAAGLEKELFLRMKSDLESWYKSDESNAWYHEVKHAIENNAPSSHSAIFKQFLQKMVEFSLKTEL